jgi:hypothetical protein
MKTFEYPMLATTLTEKDWDSIMSPVLKVVLPKVWHLPEHQARSGLCSRIPPGLGLMHPWFKQQLMHLEVFQEKSTMIHPLESSSDFLQNSQAGNGSNINITELPEKRDRTITDCWLKGMLQSSAPMA